MKTITRPIAKEVLNDLNVALATIGAKHGLAISAGNVRFSASELKTRITAQAVDADAVANGVDPRDAAMVADYAKNQTRWNKTAKIGSTINYGGSTMVFVGTKSSYRKYPVIAEGVRGGRYKLPLSAIN